MKNQIQKKPETSEAPTQPHGYRRPHYVVSSDEAGYDVSIEMPGVNRGGATVTLEKGTLTVEGNVTETASDEWRSLHRELPRRDFRLQLRLNVEVDEESIAARTEDGILKVRLPIAETAKPRSISIE